MAHGLQSGRTCVFLTDMSPSGFKLFVLENGDKYVLRGTGHFGSMSELPVAPVPASAPPGPDQVFYRHLLRWWPWLSDQSKT